MKIKIPDKKMEIREIEREKKDRTIDRQTNRIMNRQIEIDKQREKIEKQVTSQNQQ